MKVSYEYNKSSIRDIYLPIFIIKIVYQFVIKCLSKNKIDKSSEKSNKTFEYIKK